MLSNVVQVKETKLLTHRHKAARTYCNGSFLTPRSLCSHDSKYLPLPHYLSMSSSACHDRSKELGTCQHGDLLKVGSQETNGNGLIEVHPPSITRSWFQAFFYFHPEPWRNDPI